VYYLFNLSYVLKRTYYKIISGEQCVINQS